LFSALTCIPIYFSAMYSLGARKARYAAWVWALYPFAIYFSAARTWEYALTGLLFTTCFCMAQRIHHSGSLLHWLGWGTLVGLTALSNTTTLATFPFLLLLALYQARKRGSHWVLQCILACFGVLVVITPWTIRNVRALGVVCPVRDNLWLEIYVDNFGNAPFDDSSPPSAEKRPYPSTDAAEMRKFLSLGEPAYMAEKRALSLADFHLHRHDTFLVLKTLRRILYYWTGYWSFSAKELRDQPTEPPLVFYLASVTFLMMRGAIRLTKHNLSAALPYIILITAFPLAYYITNPLMDYRQAIEPAIIVLALAGAIPWNRNKQQPV